ncbi:MAG: cell wall-active antibiotics response protein [Holophagales bacterium]|jgi:predicted membrane protein|nr:cell wall-active antibiotics response protein [Holophagales bacterium]
MDKYSEYSQSNFVAKPEQNNPDDFIPINAIFSGQKLKPNSGVFDGGAIQAIFGGVELDLRQTTMKHDTAKINVFALFSGVVILLPKEWDVSIQASAFLSEVDDQSVQQPADGSARPKLVVTGTAILGGIVVK